MAFVARVDVFGESLSRGRGHRSLSQVQELAIPTMGLHHSATARGDRDRSAGDIAQMLISALYLTIRGDGWG